MTLWQPIETAPKTPTDPDLRPEGYEGPLPTVDKIDLFDGGIRSIDCHFVEGEGWYSRHKYRDAEGRRCTQFVLVPNPTHWMNSPELPQ